MYILFCVYYKSNYHSRYRLTLRRQSLLHHQMVHQRSSWCKSARRHCRSHVGFIRTKFHPKVLKSKTLEPVLINAFFVLITHLDPIVGVWQNVFLDKRLGVIQVPIIFSLISWYRQMKCSVTRNFFAPFSSLIGSFIGIVGLIRGSPNEKTN